MPVRLTKMAAIAYLLLQKFGFCFLVDFDEFMKGAILARLNCVVTVHY
jgi:hypothetical protein